MRKSKSIKGYQSVWIVGHGVSSVLKVLMQIMKQNGKVHFTYNYFLFIPRLNIAVSMPSILAKKENFNINYHHCFRY